LKKKEGSILGDSDAEELMPPIEARETGLSSSNINGITNQLASHLSKHEQSP
jgi:hypothetical protein